MIILESTYDGAGTIIENALLMTNAEAGAAGEATTITSQRLTKTAIASSPDVILIKTTAAGTNIATEYIRVRHSNQIFVADVTGTIANLAVGLKDVKLDVTGANIDAGTVSVTTGGKIEILSIDTSKSKARIKFAL